MDALWESGGRSRRAPESYSLRYTDPRAPSSERSHRKLAGSGPLWRDGAGACRCLPSEPPRTQSSARRLPSCHSGGYRDQQLGAPIDWEKVRERRPQRVQSGMAAAGLRSLVGCCAAIHPFEMVLQSRAVRAAVLSAPDPKNAFLTGDTPGQTNLNLGLIRSGTSA